jgi:hypothetical protein
VRASANDGTVREGHTAHACDHAPVGELHRRVDGDGERERTIFDAAPVDAGERSEEHRGGSRRGNPGGEDGDTRTARAPRERDETTWRDLRRELGVEPRDESRPRVDDRTLRGLEQERAQLST